MIQNAIFISNKDLIYSKVTGGVQLCSQEFLRILEAIDELKTNHYYVSFTKNIKQRIFIKTGFENYSLYDVNKDKNLLISYIRNNQIKIVFINMASLVRYAKPIRDTFGDKVKIILFSHGNHSGDFLHLLSKPIQPAGIFRNFVKKIRLGLLISTESVHRVNYLDGVIALSETEQQIENWMGANKTIFLPRLLDQNFLEYKPKIGRVGFVGRLDHPPNLQGMQILLNAFSKIDPESVEIRVVGTPKKYGDILAKQCERVTYLGELSDEDLEEEVATWALLVNPVWWYSTGASTKLGKAISWGVPIITTTAGMRGYKWRGGNILVADTPEQMSKMIIEHSCSIDAINYNAKEIKTIAKNGYRISELADLIRKIIS